jgi:hypothetical protein
MRSLFRRSPTCMLAAGQQPLVLQRMLYFKDEMFTGMFDQ